MCISLMLGYMCIATTLSLYLTACDNFIILMMMMMMMRLLSATEA